jgi:hypothetical protein
MAGNNWKTGLGRAALEGFAEGIVEVIAEEIIKPIYEKKIKGKWYRMFNWFRDHPVKKDGTLDMRYSCNWGCRK